MIGAGILAARQEAAINAFLRYVVEQIGCTDEEAGRVYDAFKAAKVLKIDAVNGTWHIKHGAFLEHDVLRHAAAEVRS